MIAVAEAGGLNQIRTKVISRFACNTVAPFNIPRPENTGVYVLLMSDNINTKDPDADLRLTFMASTDQKGIRKTSERVKWVQMRRVEQGVVFGRNMLGYDIRDGMLYINEAGNEIARLIFISSWKKTFSKAMRPIRVSPKLPQNSENPLVLWIYIIGAAKH